MTTLPGRTLFVQDLFHAGPRPGEPGTELSRRVDPVSGE